MAVEGLGYKVQVVGSRIQVLGFRAHSVEFEGVVLPKFEGNT